MRNSSECKTNMSGGYIIDNGEEYFCSNKCLYKNYTHKEYTKMFENDVAFYTTWEE